MIKCTKSAFASFADKDSIASHKKFAEKYELPFILLSDPELAAIKAYDVWQKKKMYGKTSMGVVRTAYLNDEKGEIELAVPNLKITRSYLFQNGFIQWFLNT